MASRIAAIAEAEWDGLLPADAPPFLEHRWLAALEKTGCVGDGRTWQPAHVVLHEGPRIVAAAPAYLERFSDGDFLGDEEWEVAALSRGLPYLPKLVVGIPFMPVPGPRLLIAPEGDVGALRAALADAIVLAGRATGARSVHLQLGLREEVALLAESGFVERLGCQYHWHRGDARTFSDYLNGLDGHRRRSVRHELAALDAAGIRIETLRGAQVTEARAVAAFELNRELFRSYGCEPLFTREFFAEVARTMPDRLELVHAYAPDDDRPIAAAINASRGPRLYGRYWGWRRKVKFLHFAVCYYHPIRDCCERGLVAFEPGAGGEHKRVRGFDPTPTWSAHRIDDAGLGQAVARYVSVERRLIAGHLGRPDLAAA